MSTTRPRSHDEREQVIRAVDTWKTGEGADPTAVALTERIFGQAGTGYSEVRLSYGKAVAAWMNAGDEAEGADDAFDTAFRRWARSVTKPDGTSVAKEIANLLGGKNPSELVELPYKSEVTLTQGMLERLPVELKGDAARLSELEAALGTFGPLVTDQENAVRQKLSLGAKLANATNELDTAYGKLVKALKALLGDEAVLAILPRFARRSGGGGGGGGGETPGT